MEITFTNPIYLWGLFSIPIFIIMHFITLKYIKGKALEFANFSALARVAKEPMISKNFGLLITRIFTLCCIILAVSGTIIWYYGESSDFDFVLAIDASSSMLADDYSPNRLEAAKNAANLFLDSAPSRAKIGVVSFAGTSYVEQRPITDVSKVRESLQTVSVKPIGGTDLGEAIITSSNLLLVEEKAKVVVLLTDGRSNVGISPGKAVEYANTNHITIHTIGMGTEEGGIFSGIGGNVTLRLDEETLKFIANGTGGNYYRAKTEKELSGAYNEIATSTKKKLSINLTMALMLLALFFLFVEWGLINTRYRRVP
ncbi:MAG: VWA domain-containing protein [Nanoarchaeota archaeon]|nr:VWA domain-containing protein [Nanoarchaeota archaeon]